MNYHLISQASSIIKDGYLSTSSLFNTHPSQTIHEIRSHSLEFKSSRGKPLVIVMLANAAFFILAQQLIKWINHHLQERFSFSQKKWIDVTFLGSTTVGFNLLLSRLVPHPLNKKLVITLMTIEAIVLHLFIHTSSANNKSAPLSPKQNKESSLDQRIQERIRMHAEDKPDLEKLKKNTEKLKSQNQDKDSKTGELVTSKDELNQEDKKSDGESNPSSQEGADQTLTLKDEIKESSDQVEKDSDQLASDIVVNPQQQQDDIDQLKADLAKEKEDFAGLKKDYSDLDDRLKALEEDEEEFEAENGAMTASLAQLDEEKQETIQSLQSLQNLPPVTTAQPLTTAQPQPFQSPIVDKKALFDRTTFTTTTYNDGKPENVIVNCQSNQDLKDIYEIIENPLSVLCIFERHGGLSVSQGATQLKISIKPILLTSGKSEKDILNLIDSLRP